MNRNQHIEATFATIDAALAEYVPIADPDVIEEEERRGLQELVAENWIEGDEALLLWEWFERRQNRRNC